MSDEEYKLQQEYLTPKSDRQQELLGEAQNTDIALKALLEGNVSDIVHELVVRHPRLAMAIYIDMSYYKERKAF